MIEERPYFETAPVAELCQCVSVGLTEAEQSRLDCAASQERQADLMKVFLESGRERHYDPECACCDMGVQN